MRDRVIILACAVTCIMVGFICFCILNNSVAAASADENGVSLPVIMYHNISEKRHLWGEYNVSPEVVENDIKYLKEKGYTTVSCAQVIAYCKGEGELPEKPVMLTVDDGFESFYAYMYPLLKKYGCKAVISPMGNCIDAFSEQEDHNLDYSYLTWEELKEMCDSGLVEIGNHTYDMHSDNKDRIGCGRKKGESYESYKSALNEDIGTMQEKIKQFTARECVIFTYPYGKISEGSKEILEEMGFKIILTCNGKVNSLNIGGEGAITLGRFNRPSGKTSYEFFKKILE